MSSPLETTKFIHEKIPLTSAMGIRITDCSIDRICAFAPLQPNLNHTSTVFGGSLSTIGIVSGWAYTWNLFQSWNLAASIVIRCSQTQFIRPATGTFTATTCAIADEAIAAFREELRDTGRASLTVDADISSDDRRVAIHSGVYVATRSEVEP